MIDCDLASLASVQKFADAFSAEFFELHYLILNAGMQSSTYQETEDALEIDLQVNFLMRLEYVLFTLNMSHFLIQFHLQVNHLSHFLLTSLLLPKLHVAGAATKAGSVAEPARVITVSSALHYQGKLNWDAIEAGRLSSVADFGFLANYAHSKLLNVLFANELQRRIDTQSLLQGTISSHSLHPGVIATGLSREMNPIMRLLGNLIIPLFGKSVKQGAQTTLYAALSSEIRGQGGLYLSDCGIQAPHTEAVYTKGKAFPAGEKLWRISTTLLNQRGIAVGIAQRPKPKPAPAGDSAVGALGNVRPADDEATMVWLWGNHPLV